MEPINVESVSINLSLYDDFLKVGERLGAKSSQDFCSDPDYLLDLVFSKPAEFSVGGYSCTPTDSLAFARTGMDGEHFSFLVLDNSIHTQSPIVLTSPMWSQNTNTVIAKDFRSFLCLLIRYGGFRLGDFASAPDKALKLYESPSQSEQVEDIPKRETQQLLSSIAAELDLRPYIYAPSEFASLQQRYMPLLAIPDDGL